MQRELAYLLDILQSAQLIQEFVGDIDEATFRHDLIAPLVPPDESDEDL